MPVDPARDHLNRKLRTIMHCALYRKTLKLVCANYGCGHFRLLDAVPLWWLYPVVAGRIVCSVQSAISITLAA